MNAKNYTVRNLTDITNYNVTIDTVGKCGMVTSDPVTVYGE